MTARVRDLLGAIGHLLRALPEALFPGVTGYLFPTPSALLFNAFRMPSASQPAGLPTAVWSQRERRALLAASENRLRTIETKGPGLAAANAVIAAGVVVAVDSGWDASCWPGRLLLAAAGVYAAFSLCMPLYLAGPQRRHTITEEQLVAAAGAPDPEEQLAQDAAWAAARNDRRNIVLTNLQDAARREAFYSLGLLLVWLVVGPLTGLVERA
ncbi:MAG: hypothetical protein ACRDGW_09885 [Actinomycetota bacterium]